MTSRSPRSLLAWAGALLALLATAPALADDPLKFAPDRPVDVERIDLDLSVDLEQKQVSGSATITLSALRSLQRFGLDAVDHEVSSVKVAGPKGAVLSYDYDGKRLVVERPLARGERLRVVIRYRVRDPETGLHFYGPTKESPNTPWQVWSQGETTTNRYWFPCVDHPDERQATSLTARVRPGLQVISNGVHLGTKVEGQGPKARSVWRFEQKREHVAYLVTLVVGSFDVVKGEPWRGKVPMTYYVPKGRRADALRSFARTGEMMTLFSKLTGVDYPWPKYDQVVVEQFSFGGMENTGATTLNERTLHDERAHLDYSSEGLVAHELAHQWFGDLLTCRDWAHVWLNESFATYFDALWTEHSQGADAFAYEMFQNSERGRPAGVRRPIVDRRYSSPDSMFDGRVYPKGSCVLHMLRLQLGEATFWRGIKRYTKGLADSSVESVDLRRSLERESGRNLERFFTQWTERPGHPVLDVRLQRDATRGFITVTIKQTQKGPAYAFPAELLFRFGKREVRQTLDVRAKSERFVLPEKSAPTYFRFDPREAILLKEQKVHKGRNLWIEQLRRGDLIGRIRAARHLAKDRRPAALAALREGLNKEQAYEIRCEIAKALRGVAGKPSRIALLGALADEHPKVRRAAAEALAGHGRDASVAEALAARLEAGDPSYYVEAACVSAYAAAAAEPRQLLVAALERESHNDVIRQAALNALRGLDDPSLVSHFARYTSGTFTPRTRNTATRCLSVAGLPGAPQEHVEAALSALGPLLRSSSQRVRGAALGALEAIGEAARPLLKEVDRLGVQDPREGTRERAKKVAESIRAGAPPSEQLRRLEAARRKSEQERRRLEGRVDKLESELRAQRAATEKSRKRPRAKQRQAPAKKGRRAPKKKKSAPKKTF
jgi:aminopeptidase N